MERFAVLLPKHGNPSEVHRAWAEVKAAAAPYHDEVDQDLVSHEGNCPGCGIRLAYVPPLKRFELTRGPRG